MNTLFDVCFEIVVDTEGSMSLRPGDPGNWTGGLIGDGVLKGTKWGISAAAYPQLDIANLTVADAKAIYERDYWNRIAGDALAAPLALIIFDSAVNSGVSRAVEWLQTALHLTPDGSLGPVTQAAIRAIPTDQVQAICIEALAQRIRFDAALAIWKTDALGFARRLAALPFHALTLSPADAGPVVASAT